MTRAPISLPGRTVIFDFGEVISLTPSDADRAAIARLADVDEADAERFWRAYSGHRDGLDQGTAGAISAVIALVLVVPPLVSLIPGTIANHIHGYLPNIAGQLVAQTTEQAGDVLSPWQGFGVFCIWTAVLLAACGWLLVRRDA